MLAVAPFFLVGGIAFIYVDELKKYAENTTLRNAVKIVVICYSIAFFVFQFSFIFSNLLLYTMWLIYAIIDCFRIFEKIHLANYFSNPKILYLVTLSLVVACTIIFACVWKKFEKKVVRKNT